MGLCWSCRNSNSQIRDKGVIPCGQLKIDESCVQQLHELTVTQATTSLPLSDNSNDIMSKLSSMVKVKVSKKRIRYQQDGFDLDLTYITDKIIAMGYPASNIEAVYRNDIEDVVRLLDGRHLNRYKIYNLCSERSYDITKFHNRVEVFPFDDHNPPKIDLIKLFCASVQRWLSEHDLNVAVVHCKAGKGRTGTMICCYMLHSRMFDSAEDALNYYSKKRTQDMKGVTIPSQLRYVNYYGRLLHNQLKYTPQAVYIRKLILDPSPFYSVVTVYPGLYYFHVSQHGGCGGTTTTTGVVLASGELGAMEKGEVGSQESDKSNGLGGGGGRKSSKLKTRGYEARRDGKQFAITLNTCTPLIGDIKVELFYRMLRREKQFQFWFNTFFVCDQLSACDSNSVINRNGGANSDDVEQIYELTLKKRELDIVSKKDKQNKTFSEDFKMTVLLSKVPERNKTACVPMANSVNAAANWLYDTVVPATVPLNNLNHAANTQQQQQQQQDTTSESSDEENSEYDTNDEDNWDSGESTYL